MQRPPDAEKWRGSRWRERQVGGLRHDIFSHAREHEREPREVREGNAPSRASSSRQRQRAGGWIGWRVARAGAFDRHRGRTEGTSEGRDLDEAAIGGRQQRTRASALRRGLGGGARSRAVWSLISFSIHCASHKMRAVFCCVLLVTTCSALTVNAPRPLIGTQRVRTSAVFMAAPIPARANLVPLEAIRSSTACVLHKASCLCSKARAFVIATLSAMSLRQYAYALGAVVIVAALRFLFQSDKVVRRARAEPRRCRFA